MAECIFLHGFAGRTPLGIEMDKYPLVLKFTAGHPVVEIVPLDLLAQGDSGRHHEN
jgi:hypothetical protein